MDLQPYGTFTRQLTAIERKFIADLMRVYRSFRLEMIDLVDRYGLSPRLNQGIREGIRELYHTASSGVTEIGPEIIEAAQLFVTRQVASLRKVAPAIVPAVIPSVNNTLEISQNLEVAATSWVSALDARMTAEIARLNLSGDAVDPVARLFSMNITDGRASVWRHGRNAMKAETALGVWGAANGIGSNITSQIRDRTGETYQRQAIAAIDERTTDCCLRVHGQVRDFEKPFRLTGTPRFANRMMAPPFHWNCRTAEVLYHPSMEEIGISTSEMRSAASAELTARETTGTRVEIHPAHATSRRSS